MAITFLKSILIRFRNKLANAWNGRNRDQFVKSFNENQQKEEAFVHKKAPAPWCGCAPRSG